MDIKTFDEVVKRIGNDGVSRRQALRLMGGAVFGGVLASIPGRGRAARPDCPSGVTCRGECCPAGATCVKGKGGGCSCPRDFLDCGTGTCINPWIDVNNCGGCGNICAEGQVCHGGCCVDPVDQHTCLECSSSGDHVCNYHHGCYGCFCLTTAEGTCACMQGGNCRDLQPCNTTADCPFGYSCYPSSYSSCEYNVCMLNCPDELQ
jgi:hypothetical protein